MNLRGWRIACTCAVLHGFVATASAGLLSDPAADWVEQAYELPAAPREADLIEFSVGGGTQARFLIDAETLSVGTDGVVRYALVALSPSGVRNVTAEGIRCANWTWRIYASGRADGQWAAARSAKWEAIVNTTYNRARAALATDVFCDGSVPPRDRGEVLRRLRNPQAAQPRGQ